MAAQKGKDLVLKIRQTSGTYRTVAGLRARRIAFNADAVDATDSDSGNRWRELLAEAGVKRVSISGDGIFKDDSSDELIRSVFFGAEIVMWEIVIPHFVTLRGDFQITSLEYSGNHDGELNFRIALESAGEITSTNLAR